MIVAFWLILQTLRQSGRALRLRDAGWVLSLTVQAFIRLVRARIAFSRLAARELPARNAAAAGADRAEQADELLADRIGFVVARLAKRLPWRSACMIQAIAALALRPTTGARFWRQSPLLLRGLIVLSLALPVAQIVRLPEAL